MFSINEILGKTFSFEGVDVIKYLIIACVSISHHSVMATNTLTAPPTASDNTGKVYNGGSIGLGWTYTIDATGNIFNSGNLLNNGAFNLVAGAVFRNNNYLTSNGTISNAGNLINQPGAIIYNNNNILNNNVLYNGGFYFNNGTIDNHGYMPSPSGIFYNQSGGIVNNFLSIFLNTASTFTNQNGSVLNNAGTFQMSTNSVLNNENGSTINNSGNFQVYDSSIFNNENGGIFNNSNNLYVSDGPAHSGGIFNNQSGGVLNNSGTVTITSLGVFNNSGNVSNTNILNNSGTFNNNNTFYNQGIANNRSGSTFTNNNILSISNGHTFNNQAGGTFTNNNNLDIGGTFNIQAGSTFTNNNLMNIQTTGVLNNSSTLRNQGTSAALYLRGAANNTGVIASSQGASVLIVGATIFQGAGTMTFSNSYLTSTINTSIPWGIGLGLSASNLFTSATGTTLTLTGVISNNSSSNPGGFRFTGPGTLALTGNNTYSGGTAITGGTVNVGHNNALGTGGVTLSGATLQAAGNYALANAITFGTNTSSILDNNGHIFTLNGPIDGTGAVTFKGTGTTIVSHSNTYSGTSTLGSVGNPTTLTMLDPNALGTGPIALAGGSTLNPNAGALTLTSTRSLSGVGTVAGDVVNNGGSFTPGIGVPGSYGAMNFGGNYTGSGNLILNFGPSVAPVAGTDYGVLNLGAHNFDASHTTLTLNPYQGTYTPGAQYHFLTTTGNVNSTFSNDQALPNLGAYKPVISYNPQLGGGAILTVEMNRIYLTEALGGNADGVSRPTAAYFDAQPNPFLGTPLGDLIGQLDNLTGSTLDSALDRVAPEESDDATYLLQQSTLHAHTTHESRTLALRQGPTGGAGQGAFRLASLSSSPRRTTSALAFLQSMNDQNHSPSSIFSTTKAGFKADADAAMQENVEKTLGRGGYWTHAFGNLTRQKSTADDLGFRSQAGGLMAGGDLKLSSHHFFGLSGGYTKTIMKIDNDGGTHHLNSFILGAYGTWYSNAFALDYSLNGSINTYKLARRVIIPGGTTSDVKSTHKGYEISPRIGLSYELPVENMHVVPFVNTSYSFMRENGYRESGGLIDQQINGRHSSFFNTEAGMSVSKDYTLNDKIFTPFFKLSYLYKRPINTGKVVASFIDAQGSYSIQSTNKAVHQIAPQLAGTVRWESGLYMEAAYGAELSHKLQSHELVLKLGKRF